MTPDRSRPSNGRTADAETADRLARLTLDLVDVASPSRQEGALTERLWAALPRSNRFPAMLRRGDGVYLGPERKDPGRPFVLLAGHTDTVPAQGNMPGRIEDGAVWGLGSADMKGGLAVMLELARRLAARPPEHPARPLEDPARPHADGSGVGMDIGLLFFGREEVSAAESPLPDLFEAWPVLLQADLVVVMEPTDNALHAGCMGNLTVQAAFRGVGAHSARPWLGVNAIHRAVEALRAVVALEPLDVEVEGLMFREVTSVTSMAGGVAPNVIPDLVRCLVNHRYGPGRSPADAERRVRELLGPEAEVTVLSNSPPAPVALDNPLVARLRAAGDLPVLPKQAWTPVAEFAARGLDAVNFGPGATELAHRADERVSIAALVRSFRVLGRFLGLDAAEPDDPEPDDAEPGDLVQEWGVPAEGGRAVAR